MPTKTGKTYASFYKNDLAVDQTGNTGVDATTRKIQDGAGNNSSISLSDDVLSVQPETDNTTGTMLVKNQGGDNILAVDTTNSKVLVGAGQVSANTHFKEMGLYEFSPNAAGNHYPLIANRVGMQGAEALTYDDDWGNAGDPPASLDVSGLTDTENAIAIYWYLENNITLDSVRFFAIGDGTATIHFHIFAYDLDVSSNHGDLSNGTVHAAGSGSVSSSQIKTGTLTLNTANIDASKVVIGFVENATGTDDLSVHLNIKYHIR